MPRPTFMNNVQDVTRSNSIRNGLAQAAVENARFNAPYAELQQNNPGATILTPSISGDFSGSDNIAQVHRAEWEDYLSRFAPVENMLFNRFNDPNDKQQAIDKSAVTMGTAFDQSREQADRGMSRYGLKLTEDQTMKRDRSYALDKAAAVVGAKNATRTAKEDQRMAIMTGGLSSVSQNKGK